MDEKEIDLLQKICDLYREVSYRTTGKYENELDHTSIEDTLARLKSGEYEIVKNKDY